MQRQTNDPKSLSGRREFLKSAGAAAAGLYLAGSEAAGRRTEPAPAAKHETLALNGGPKAVTAPTGNATRWPLYGEEEEKEVAGLLRNANYGPIAEFEKAWAEFHKVPTARPTATAPAR